MYIFDKGKSIFLGEVTLASIHHGYKIKLIPSSTLLCIENHVNVLHTLGGLKPCGEVTLSIYTSCMSAVQRSLAELIPAMCIYHACRILRSTSTSIKKFQALLNL